MTAIRKSTRISKVAINYKEKKVRGLSKRSAAKIKSLPAENIKPLKAVVTKKEKNPVEKKTTVLKTIEIKHMSKKFDLLQAVDHLKTQDPKLGIHLTEQIVADFQERLRNPDASNPFRSLSKMIIYQQIHGKAAASIYAKLLALFGRETDAVFPTPLEILEKPVDELRSAGLSARKVGYIFDLANKFNEGLITPENFDTMSDLEISQKLCSVKGIGQWTADMYLMFNLHHPDVLPVGDLAIRKAVAKHFGLQNTKKIKVFPTTEDMEEITKIWKPYRTVASWLLWKMSDTKVAD